MGQKLSLVVCVGLPLLQASISSLASHKHVKTWYKKLKKPKWTPPNWFFAPMWCALYTCMGVASWLVWKKGGFAKQTVPLTLYAIQLFLNTIWTPIFFNAHNVKLALADVFALDAAVVATTIKFFEVSRPAGCLMCPTLCFLVFVTALNTKLAIDNPNADKLEEIEKKDEGPSERRS